MSAIVVRHACMGDIDRLHPRSTVFEDCPVCWVYLQEHDKLVADLRESEQAREAAERERNDAIRASLHDLTERDAALEQVAEYERLKGELNMVLHPNGDGPSAPAFCDLIAYVRGDLAKLAEVKELAATWHEFESNDPRDLDLKVGMAYKLFADELVAVLGKATEGE